MSDACFSGSSDCKLYAISQIVYYTIISISMLCSLEIFWLIYKIRLKLNCFLTIILHFSTHQFLFDVALLLSRTVGTNNTFSTACFFLVNFFGINVSFIITLLGFVVTYICYTRNYIDMQTNLKGYLIVVFIISATLAGIIAHYQFIDPTKKSPEYATSVAAATYLRITLALCNILMYGITYTQLRQMKITKLTKNNSPIFILSQRMLLYPVSRTK